MENESWDEVLQMGNLREPQLGVQRTDANLCHLTNGVRR